MKKRELVEIVQAAGLTVEGKESMEELAEAITYLVQARKVSK